MAGSASISNLKIISITQTSVRITFDTSEACDTEQILDLQLKDINNSFIAATYTQNVPAGFNTINHAIDLTVLNTNTVYIVSVSCVTIATTLLVQSDVFEFSTTSGSIYHTTADVKKEVKNFNTTSINSIITEAQLQEYCNQTEAVVTGELSKKYIIPITGTISLGIMKNLCILMTASRVNKILRRNAAELVNAGDSQRSTGLSAEAKEMYDKVINQKILLTDAVRVELVSNSVTYNDTDEGVLTFSPEKKSWW